MFWFHARGHSIQVSTSQRMIAGICTQIYPFASEAVNSRRPCERPTHQTRNHKVLRRTQWAVGLWVCSVQYTHERASQDSGPAHTARDSETAPTGRPPMGGQTAARDGGEGGEIEKEPAAGKCFRHLRARRMVVVSSGWMCRLGKERGAGTADGGEGGGEHEGRAARCRAEHGTGESQLSASTGPEPSMDRLDGPAEWTGPATGRRLASGPMWARACACMS